MNNESTIIIAIVLTILFVGCEDGHNSQINSLKASGKLYPKETQKKIKVLNFVDTQYVWVNTAYSNYLHKELFPELINIEIDLTKPEVISYLGNDSTEFAKYLTRKLHTVSATHYIGQSILLNKLNVYFYTTEEGEGFSALYDLNIPSKTEFKKDPSWKRYQELQDKK